MNLSDLVYSKRLFFIVLLSILIACESDDNLPASTEYRIKVNSINGQRLYYANTIPAVIATDADYFQRFDLDQFPNGEFDLFDSCYFWQATVVEKDNDYGLLVDNSGFSGDTIQIKELALHAGDLIFFQHSPITPIGFDLFLTDGITIEQLMGKIYDTPEPDGIGELVQMTKDFTGTLVFLYGTGQLIFDDLLIQSDFDIDFDKPFCGDIAFTEFSAIKSGKGFIVTIITTEEQNGINMILERNLDPNNPNSNWEPLEVFDFENNPNGTTYSFIDN